LNILITICARGGSKGIPGKNIKEIAGRPLISYSIETAKKFAEIVGAKIEISTDDSEIKRVASKFGLSNNYNRPVELGTDFSGKIDVLYDILKFAESTNDIKFDYVLDLDVTSPLRTVDDLSNAFELIKKDEGALNLFSVNNASRNPYFNMVEIKENGYYGLVKSSESFLTRQAAPKVYDLNASFYFYKRGFFYQQLKSAITTKSLIYEMPHICFDLDHPIDFEFMQFLIEKKKLGFEL
jgi:CMP-N,N'-diacetyllegionaminic acid synthase